MRDEQTGSYWQQISGKAVSGPLSGQQLPFVHSDELNFGTWQSEEPQGTVLQDDAPYRTDTRRRIGTSACGARRW
jgi:hypothetical protein